MNLNSLIDTLPKTELHLHIEGTLEPAMMLALAKRNNIKLPYKNIKQITAAFQFNNLQDFLDIYYQGMSVLIHEGDFYDLTMAYLHKIYEQGVRHVEIFFDPQAHTERNIAFETVVDGIAAALMEGHKQMAISARLIMCFLRHLSPEAAFETLQHACKYKQTIFGVGLDSGERNRPPYLFSHVYAQARQQGFVAVAHAGEEGPADYVRSALDDLKVERIDHGNRAFDDPVLINRIVRQKIPLTMCPLSNLRLKGVSNLGQHPLKHALRRGVIATVNSDDPSYFGGYINENYKAITVALDLSANDIIKLAKNSYAAAFISAQAKQDGFDKIDAQVEIWKKANHNKHEIKNH